MKKHHTRIIKCLKIKTPDNLPSISSISPSSSHESDLGICTAHVKKKNKFKQVPSNEEVYLNGQLSTFCLFMMLCCLLSTSILVAAISSWCLFWNNSNSYLTNIDNEESVMFIAALLLLISSLIGTLTVIIACVANDQQDSTRNLHFMLLFFSSLVLVLGGFGALLSFKLKTHWKFSLSADEKRTKHPLLGTHKKVILEDCEQGHALSKTLLRKIQEYNTSDTSKKSWDSTQLSLECCGVNGPADWLKYFKVIPESCCKMNGLQKEDCNLNSAFRDGCIDVLAFYLRWWLATLGGHGCLHLSVTVAMLILILYFLFIRQRNVSKEKICAPLSSEALGS